MLYFAISSCVAFVICAFRHWRSTLKWILLSWAYCFLRLINIDDCYFGILRNVLFVWSTSLLQSSCLSKAKLFRHLLLIHILFRRCLQYFLLPFLILLYRQGWIVFWSLTFFKKRFLSRLKFFCSRLSRLAPLSKSSTGGAWSSIFCPRRWGIGDRLWSFYTTHSYFFLQTRVHLRLVISALYFSQFHETFLIFRWKIRWLIEKFATVLKPVSAVIDFIVLFQELISFFVKIS